MIQEDLVCLGGEESLIATPMGGSSGASDDWHCGFWDGIRCYAAMAAAVFGALAAWYASIGLYDAAASMLAIAAAYAAIASYYNDLFKENCSDSSSSSSSIQTIIDTIITGETVEVSEIFDVLQMMEGETYDCGCN